MKTLDLQHPPANSEECASGMRRGSLHLLQKSSRSEERRGILHQRGCLKLRTLPDEKPYPQAAVEEDWSLEKNKKLSGG